MEKPGGMEKPGNRRGIRQRGKTTDFISALRECLGLCNFEREYGEVNELEEYLEFGIWEDADYSKAQPLVKNRSLLLQRWPKPHGIRGSL